MICPYCGAEANLVDSSIVYGKSYGKIYLCSSYPQCDAYVGVHKGTDEPLGRLANAELREWKKKAHKAFDIIWKSGGMSRDQAYQLLQRKMKLSEEEAHIGKFDVDQCKRVVSIFQ